LAPGFAIQRQSLDLNYVAGDPSRTHVQVTYRLMNAGNSDLTALQATIPSLSGLHVTVDSREVTVQSSSGKRVGVAQISIPFEPAWPQKAWRNVEIGYDIAVAQRAAGAVPAIYFSQSEEWFPELQKPHGMMAKGSARAAEVDVSIQVPQGFQTLSSGQTSGVKASPGGAEYRYRLRSRDFEPFVLSGKYQERKLRVSGITVIFWTMAPLAEGESQKAANGIAVATQAFENSFGPRTPKNSPVWVIEETGLKETAGDAGPAGASLPSAVLLNRESFAQGVSSPAFLELATRELARTWFGWMAAPQQELAPDRNLGNAIVEYAVIVAAEARGGGAKRVARAADLLRKWNELQKQEKDKPLLLVDFKDSPLQQDLAATKSTLFLLALEDACGREQFRRALTRITHAMQGKEFGLGVLRSALEAETHKQWGDTFREWLDHPGIPGDFRARYERKPSSGN
jgi:hypothetical protein